MPLVIDTNGKIYDLLGQVLGAQQAAAQTLGLILTNQEKIMADLATLQAAVGGIVTAEAANKQAVDQLVAAEGSLAAAVQAVSDFIKQLESQGTSIPDSLVQDLTNAAAEMSASTTALGTASGDLSTQVQNLANAASAP